MTLPGEEQPYEPTPTISAQLAAVYNDPEARAKVIHANWEQIVADAEAIRGLVRTRDYDGIAAFFDPSLTERADLRAARISQERATRIGQRAIIDTVTGRKAQNREAIDFDEAAALLDITVIDADEFEAARKDPKNRALLKEAQEYYGRQIKSKTEVEFGHNYSLNNGDMGVILSFQTGDAEFDLADALTYEQVPTTFKVAALTSDPEYYVARWDSKVHPIHNLIAATDILADSSEDVTTSAWVAVTGQEAVLEYPKCSIGELHSQSKAVLDEGSEFTGFGIAFENGDEVIWASPTDPSNEINAPILEMRIKRERKDAIKALVMATLRTSGNPAKAASEAIDRLDHAANF